MTIGRGYPRYKGDGTFEMEPNVFHIQDIDVVESQQNQGYGKEFLLTAINMARQEGFEFGRGYIINPTVVRLIERLREEASVTDVVYHTAMHGEKPQMTTQEILQSPERLTYQQAEAQVQIFSHEFNQAVAEGRDPDPNLIGVDCVIKL